MTDTELEWRFIRAKLIGHGLFLNEKLHEAILTQQLIDSRTLSNSLRFRVNMDESVASGELVIEFKLYGRFQEIGAGRKAVNRTDFLDEFIGSRSTRRRRQWYNKTVYGTLNDLIFDLVNGFTDETKEMLISHSFQCMFIRYSTTVYLYGQFRENSGKQS